jgi:hypothetical protein
MRRRDPNEDSPSIARDRPATLEHAGPRRRRRQVPADGARDPRSDAGLSRQAHDAEQLIAAYRRGGLDIVLPDKAVGTGIQGACRSGSAPDRFKVFAS